MAGACGVNGLLGQEDRHRAELPEAEQDEWLRLGVAGKVAWASLGKNTRPKRVGSIWALTHASLPTKIPSN
jgi:hypothetical protein